MLIVVVSFFWKERIDFSNKVNYEKVTAFFTILAALGTSFSIFLLYRQVFIMNAQLKYSSLPDLYIEDIKIAAKIFINDNDKSDGYTLLLKDESPYFGDVNFYNWGNGVAKEIEFDWSINEVEFIIFQTSSNFKNSLFRLSTSKSKSFLAHSETDTTEFPISWREIIQHHLLFHAALSNTYIALPKMYLTVSYKDKFNYSYKKEYSVSAVALPRIGPGRVSVGINFSQLK